MEEKLETKFLRVDVSSFDDMYNAPVGARLFFPDNRVETKLGVLQDFLENGNNSYSVYTKDRVGNQGVVYHRVSSYSSNSEEPLVPVFDFSYSGNFDVDLILSKKFKDLIGGVRNE